MIGMIIATHGEMSNGIVSAADLIIGSTDNIKTLNLFQEDDVQDLNGKFLKEIKAVDQNEGIIIFVDLAGASLYNQAVLAVNSLADEQKKKIHVVAGVNLPMVIDAINQRMIDASIEDAVASVVNVAQQGIVTWSAEDTDADDEDEDEEF
ncbi:PTS system, IIA component [Carnobacterium sp. AT7]|uniref:PTS sugar transporter subunit IIA n=1 Tax=Carnobacterium sp. AT7 TaxID=333990 RepID=UPI00015F2A06|nr:PTS sugar transporter subunit IIA [Carnobacterium sp. AT7]EDP67342.1 PTS system, IIA component [Carnobacterium sp. AT7]